MYSAVFILFLKNLHPFQAFDMNTKVIASEVKSDPLSLGSRLYQQETQSSCFRTKQKKDYLVSHNPSEF